MSKLIKLSITLLFPIILAFILMFIFSLLILSTNIPESLTSLFYIISICITCILATISNVLMYKTKGIWKSFTSSNTF